MKDKDIEKISECPDCKVGTKGTAIFRCENCNKYCCENCGNADGNCVVCGHPVKFVAVIS